MLFTTDCISQTALLTSTITGSLSAAQFSAPILYNLDNPNSAVSGIADCARAEVTVAIARSSCIPTDRNCICSKLDLITQINRIISADCGGEDLQTSSAWFINYCPNIRVVSRISSSSSPSSFPSPSPSPSSSRPTTTLTSSASSSSSSIISPPPFTSPPPNSTTLTPTMTGICVTNPPPGDNSTVITFTTATGVSPPEQTVNAAGGVEVPWVGVGVVGAAMVGMGVVFAEL